jgi:FAD synthetase
MMPTKTSTRPTAGIIIIGDEILKGQIQDDNTVFLAKELHSCGIKLDRVSIIPDDIDVIAEEIKVFCSRFTYVFTTGGLGPTHDDVTIDGIAKAFNDEIIIHPEMMEVLEMHHNDLNEATIKMAKVTESYI